MPKFPEHLKESIGRYPEYPKEIHESTHKWMDDPANFTIGAKFRDGRKRKHGYSGLTHRDIRHLPEKVANALSGIGTDKRTKRWKRRYDIAKCHHDLDEKDRKIKRVKKIIKAPIVKLKSLILLR